MLLGAFSLFQIALAAGAPWGRYAWGGFSDPLSPGLRTASAAAVVYLAIAASVLLVRAGDLGRNLPRTPFLWGHVFVTVQLGLNTLANLAAKTATEQYGMTFASALAFVLAARALRSPKA